MAKAVFAIDSGDMVFDVSIFLPGWQLEKQYATLIERAVNRALCTVFNVREDADDFLLTGWRYDGDRVAGFKVHAAWRPGMSLDVVQRAVEMALEQFSVYAQNVTVKTVKLVYKLV